MKDKFNFKSFEINKKKICVKKIIKNIKRKEKLRN